MQIQALRITAIACAKVKRTVNNIKEGHTWGCSVSHYVSLLFEQTRYRLLKPSIYPCLQALHNFEERVGFRRSLHWEQRVVNYLGSSIAFCKTQLCFWHSLVFHITLGLCAPHSSQPFLIAFNVSIILLIVHFVFV